MPHETGLAWDLRVAAWDRALAATRAALRSAGMREVSTPVRVEVVALEPWIEPVASGDAYLATSPELTMKRLLARGSGSIFQVAHVFRAAERGAQHREEFHLVEWYRDQRGVDPGLGPAMADVERLVAAVFEALAELGLPTGPGSAIVAPRRWRRVSLIELMAQTLGQPLDGDEPATCLEPILRRVREAVGVRLGPGARPRDPALAQLLAWTELFSLWSDLHLDPWLAQLEPDVGVHVHDFPASLAALAELEVGGRRARRFESHVGGIELANGYFELRDPIEQRRRFALVGAMREHAGLGPLPTPEAFLGELARVPPCAGVALGLDRLVALACGRRRLDEVALAP